MSVKLIISFIMGLTLLLILGLFALSISSKPEVPVVNYQKTEADRPILSIEATEADFGTIRVKQEVSKDFVVKNTGSKPLQISKINSSCNCTSAKFIYGGKESAEFGMHNPGLEVYEIAPNTEATITVIYRPFVMPVYGFVSREVYTDTNDPNLSKLVLRIKANVN